MSHLATQPRPDSRPSSLIWGSCIRNQVRRWSHTFTHMHSHTTRTRTLGAIAKRGSLSKGHGARTSVKAEWQSSMHWKKRRIREKNGKGKKGINVTNPLKTSEGLLLKTVFREEKKIELNLQLPTLVWPLSWMRLLLVPPSVLFWLLSCYPGTSARATCAEQRTCEKTAVQLKQGCTVMSP